MFKQLGTIPWLQWNIVLKREKEYFWMHIFIYMCVCVCVCVCVWNTFLSRPQSVLHQCHADISHHTNHAEVARLKRIQWWQGGVSHCRIVKWEVPFFILLLTSLPVYSTVQKHLVILSYFSLMLYFSAASNKKTSKLYFSERRRERT